MTATATAAAARRGGRLAGLAVALALAAPAAAASARTSLFERIPGADPCQEAASYGDEDIEENEDAQRAHRRCRMEEFARLQSEQRREKWLAAERKRQERLALVQAANQPPRAAMPIAVDLFLGGGLADWGLALAFAPRPDLEVEAWFGDNGVEHTSTSTMAVDADGTAGGLRAKWITGSGTASPFFSGGVVGAFGDLTSYAFGTRSSAVVGGHGSAHALQAGVGVTLVASFGLRVSLEYLLAFVIYAQASRNEPMMPHDPDLKEAWKSILEQERQSVRFQVGYAF